MDKLLLVDDDTEVLQMNRRYFAGQGFEVRVADCGDACLAVLRDFSPDCIVLDVMMPGMDGVTLLGAIRAAADTPVLFLTGRGDEDTKVRALMTGGDDYIVKPCGLPELHARIAANVRRHRAAARAAPAGLSFPPLEIDVAAHQVYCDGENLGLSNREYDLLYLLATHEGELVTFEEIAQQLWGVYRPEDRRVMMVSLSRLRKKLAKPVDLTGMIETVWSKGYRFVDRFKR